MFTLQVTMMALAIQTGASVPSDFAFRFDHKGCHYEQVDTFRAHYSHVGQTPRVPFVLSEAHRQLLCTAIVESGFFEMPQFASNVGSADPADTYELEVRANGRFHTVAWTVNSDDPFARLERFFVSLMRIVENHPDVLRLPRRGDGCAEGPPAIR